MPEEMREGFMFFRSYYEGAKELDDEQRLAFYDAVIEYALNGKEPAVSGVPKSCFHFVKPVLDKSKAKAKAGSRGGRSKTEASGKQTQANGKQTASKPEAIKDKGINIKDKGSSIKDEDLGGLIPPSPPKAAKTAGKKAYGEFSKVKLTDEEYSKLVQRLGKDGAERYIVRLDGWLAEGNVKKNHYATILNWWRKDGEPGAGEKARRVGGQSSYDIDELEDFLRASSPRLE